MFIFYAFFKSEDVSTGYNSNIYLLIFLSAFGSIYRVFLSLMLMSAKIPSNWQKEQMVNLLTPWRLPFIICK